MQRKLEAQGKRSAIRVAFVTPTIAPYRIPLFNRFTQLPGVHVDVICADEYERNKLWSEYIGNPAFGITVLPSRQISVLNAQREETDLFFSPNLWHYLDKQKYDLVIVLGWTMPNSGMALLRSKWRHTPVVLWDESIPHRPGKFKRLLMPFLHKYWGAYDGYFAASSACIEYMVTMGAPRDRIVLMPQIADNQFFGEQAKIYRAARERWKQELGITTSKVILFVGQLIQRKGVLPLFDAFQALAAAEPDVSLVYVGEGLLCTELMEKRRAAHLEQRVLIHDFAPQAELPKFYGLADVFVLPSYYDTFGVVISEAMASGLPIITTHNVGAAADLVRDHDNGLVVEAGNVDALTGAMRLLVQDDALRARMGAQSEARIANWTVEQGAQGLVKCLELCCEYQIS